MCEHSVHVIGRSAARVGVWIGVLVVSFAVLPLRGERWWLGALIGLAVLVATVPVTLRRVRSVLRSDRPGLEVVEAITLLLTMLVVGFAAVYFAMDRNHDQFAGLDTRIDAVYFTVSTLSTVGFGDITATGSAARLAVTVQMLFNLVFVGVVVRAFVGAARRAAQRPPHQ